MTTRTMMFVASLAVLSLVTPASAQFYDFSHDPWADFDSELERSRRTPWPQMSPPVFQPPAQTYDDPFAASRRYRERMDAIDRRQREQENLWQRYASQRDPQVDFMQRRYEDRRNDIRSCLGYSGNPAARAACLDAIR